MVTDPPPLRPRLLAADGFCAYGLIYPGHLLEREASNL